MAAGVPFWYDLGQFLWIPTTTGFLGPPWLKGSANSPKGSDSGFAMKFASSNNSKFNVNGGFLCVLQYSP